MEHRLILFLLLISMSVVGQETIDTTEALISDQISNIEISSTSARKADNSISLSRKQFLTMAGALEDPTRLLIKFPGISTVNDQANTVVYHGMPAQYHKWSVYGARILNPNHLGNAGTISDFPSRSAGGVNMLSGQVIGNLEFNSNPSGSSLDALSASSDIKLRDPYQNSVTTNLSLIGLEVGIDRITNDGKGNFLLNYRYSTVGLLTSLGLDFGGEIINYQDLTGKYSRNLENGDKLSMYFSAGFDSNTKDAIPLDIQPETHNDRRDIDYNSSNFIGGFLYNRNKENFTFNNTVNISFNSTERISLIPTSSIFQVTNSEYKNDEMLISSKHDYTILSNDWNLGFTFEPYLHSISLEKKYPDNSQEFLNERSINRNALHLIPSVHSMYKLSEHLDISGRIGIQSVISDENLIDFIGQAELKYSKSNFISSLRYSKAAQIFQPEILIYSIEPDFAKSNNLEANASYKGFGVSGFLHHITNVPISTLNYGFSAFENLDNLPLRNSLGPVIIRPQGKVDIYGVAFSMDNNIAGYNLSSNITLTDSKHFGVDVQTKAPLDYGHIFNLILSKNWKIGQKKQLGFSTSFHHRGGSRQNQVDLNNSFIWGYTNFEFDNPYATRLSDYYRVDLRIIYKPSKKSTISLDIQNVTNRENDAYFYYEGYWSQSTLKKQLGMIPILSWKVDW